MHYTTSCYTQSSAPEDGRDQRPKHVELIGIINKSLLLHLVGVYIIYLTRKSAMSALLEFILLVREFLNVQIVVSNPEGDMDVCLHLSVLRSFVWRLSWTDSPSMASYPETEKPDCCGINSSSERVC